MQNHFIELETVKNTDDLVKRAKWLEGKTLKEIDEEIQKNDQESRVITKGHVGYVIEKGFFGIDRNSEAEPDIKRLGVEIKTCPLKYTNGGKKLTVKEPLSLNIINYMEEHKHKSLKESSVYKKNRRILFVFYIHDRTKDRSRYVVKYVFLWEMDDKVLQELQSDYFKITQYIRDGEAHEIHQHQHKWLTLCPKHNGTFKDPKDRISKRPQPFSTKPGETRAFRLKNSYVVRIIRKYLGLPIDSKPWSVDA